MLTSVNRDDLADGGAGIFAETLRELRTREPAIGIEFLTPDFQHKQDEAAALITSALDAVTPHQDGRTRLIWGHNVETVPRLYRTARKGARYETSLAMLARAATLPGVEAKSALMLGLGETREEVMQVLRDLRANGVERLSLGQYLRPSRDNLPVVDYIHPDEFARYEQEARAWASAGSRPGRWCARRTMPRKNSERNGPTQRRRERQYLSKDRLLVEVFTPHRFSLLRTVRARRPRHGLRLGQGRAAGALVVPRRGRAVNGTAQRRGAEKGNICRKTDCWFEVFTPHRFSLRLCVSALSFS
ncbi:MAG: hypothetical protein MZV65_19545 [Chromatiales bacterium]|nr:hypothetical protein [Chromatiales bacterium]